MKQEIRLTPLTTTIGARIEGVDLRLPLDQETAQTIRDALAEHCVLIFEKQDIDLPQQKTFAEIFGAREMMASHALSRQADTTEIIDNALWETVTEHVSPLPQRFVLADEFQGWHADGTYCPQISSIAILRAELLSEKGGGTCWANLAEAYDALSPAMQGFLETLDVIHAPPEGERAFLGVAQLPEAERARWNRELSAQRHPLVVRHEASGRKLLFVNPAYSIKIENLNNSESAMLLRYLFNHCINPNFIYRHRWNEGDIVVWDELATIHLAPTDYYPQRRRLVRVNAGLTKPQAARVAA